MIGNIGARPSYKCAEANGPPTGRQTRETTMDLLIVIAIQAATNCFIAVWDMVRFMRKSWK